ncbi:MAG: EAL domain-containing protein [Candidatus Accumulibacter sp.]|nr:EAL domain-containing protein [Accumulibacter sp.]
MKAGAAVSGNGPANEAAHYRSLAENSPDCIVRYDRCGRRLYANPAHERTSGLPASATLGKTPRELSCLPAAAAAAYQERLLAVVAGGRPADIEIEWKTPDGRRMVQHVVALPEHGPDGAVASVLTVARDISALKETERRLEQAEAMARLGSWQWSARTGRATLSAETCRIFGRPHDWVPDREEILALIVEEDRDWIATALNVTFASQSPDAAFDCRIQTGDAPTDLHSALRIEYDADGKPSLVVGTTQDVTELRGYQQRVHSLASYDPLTTLPNREQFTSRAQHAIGEACRHRQQVGILILDLDRFKAVNDALGHGGGDRLLCEAAVRLRRCVRETDTVARLGGDEFGFVLPDMPPQADIGKVCRKILDAVGETYRIAGREIFLTGSIGIARYPFDGRSVSDLLQHADAAMYHAKAAGRDNYQFYAASLTTQITERLGLAARLRRAVSNGELELYYQPQIDLRTRRLIGAEALLRWNHPEEGLVPPDRFIGIAEETGLIVGIGEWVLRTACATVCAWNRDARPPLRIAVNLSPRQFKTNDLVATVRTVLAETGCAPEWLELEITEGLLLDDTVDVARTLAALRALGLSIAIDDFGTGYSALGYLNRFPVQAIKIDRSFVRDIVARRDSAELVKAIIAMAHSLRLTLVAEGIEERRQEEFLRAHGCQLGQGYLFGKPMPGRDFASLLASAARGAAD